MSTQIKNNEVQAIFDRIVAKEKFRASVNGNFGREIDTLLRGIGFKSYESHSRCSVADFESDLERNGVHVSIIVANLFGVFTEVAVR